MRKTLIAILVGIGLAILAAPQGFSHYQRDSEDLPELDEFRQVYELSPGSRVSVGNINGKVTIESHYGDTAEVHVIRSARTREDLAYRKVLVGTDSEGGLVVRGEDDRRGRHVRVHQRVIMKVPRNISLSLNDINGHTSVGEIEGPVHLNDINGGVGVKQAAEYAEATDINGGLEITIVRLGSRGIRLVDINGGVELRFAEDLNADLTVDDVNGGVHGEMTANMTVQGKMDRSSFRARIGNGGAPISVTDVNGGLRLGRARSAG